MKALFTFAFLVSSTTGLLNDSRKMGPVSPIHGLRAVVFHTNGSDLLLSRGTRCDGKLAESDPMTKFNAMLRSYRKKSSASGQFLVYKAQQGTGGWGSRMWGMANAFLWALLTNRIFVIEYAAPHRLQGLIFDPNIVDWTVAVPVGPRHKLVHKDGTLPANMLLGADLAKEWKPFKVVEIVGANMGCMTKLCQNPHYNLENMGIPCGSNMHGGVCSGIGKFEVNRKREELQAQVMFPLLWHTLFTPSPSLLSTAKPILDRMNSFSNIVGVHLRYGGVVGGASDPVRLGACTRKTDCLAHDLNNIPKAVMGCVANMTTGMKSVGLFVSSDQTIPPWVFVEGKKLGMEVFYAPMQRTVHTDRSKGISVSEWQGTLVDWLALSRTNPLIQSASSFSSTAAMWAGLAPNMIAEACQPRLEFARGPANTVAQHHVPDANKRAELVEAVKKKHPHPPQELVVPACDGANSASIVKSSAWRALVDFQKVLESMDAPSMIYSGTVLGLARHCDPTIGKRSDDVDFAVDSNWLRLNFRELAKKMVSGGFQPKWYFPGAHEERSFQSIPQKILNVKGFEVSWTHRNKMKVDLFGVTVTNATIEWGLWTGRTAFDWNDCIGQATDVVPFTWHGLKVHVPVPVDAYLTSFYGKKYMTPAKWTWDVEPFTIGSCTRTPRSASLRALEQQYPHR